MCIVFEVAIKSNREAHSFEKTIHSAGVTGCVRARANHVDRQTLIGAKMIRPLNTTQMTSAKPRSGLQSIGDLLPKLMRMYELQAEARKQIEEDEQRRAGQGVATVLNAGQASANSGVQQAFAWYQ